MTDYSKYLKKHNYFFTMDYEAKTSDIAAIDNLLAKYGIAVTRYMESPTIVQYRVQLTPNCNITAIMKLQPNLCIALDCDNVRVFREKSELVIEKKGADNILLLGDLYNEQFRNAKGMKIILGKDSTGQNLYTDLRKAPHLLVAGTTGSGKSIFLHSVILSLLMKNPSLEIYGIDTKATEFANYRRNPAFHFISDAGTAIRTLSKLCVEMDSRYRTLSQHGCRDMESANAKGIDMKPIVVVIDEFADLMLLSGKEVEQYVVRLAQKARACGIHLVIATQRPTADVITGLIKANMPTRVCLKVNSGLDSRIILDRKGGESLSGHGDMLYLGNGMFEPIRIQGCYMEESEIISIASVSGMNNPKKPKPQKDDPISPVTKSYFHHLFNGKK